MENSSKKKYLLVSVFVLALAIILAGIFGLPKKIYYALIKKEKITVIKLFSFSSEDSIKEWDKKVFNDKVDYRVESQNEESYIHAISNCSCSALYSKLKLDVYNKLYMSWKWKVLKFPDKKSADNLSSVKEDDFAARVYVIFPALFFSNSKVLEYIWAKDLKVGTIASSPYSDNIKIIVAESGPKDGSWVTEDRNIYRDYVSAFNSNLSLKIGAIAFMCDSDSSGSAAEAFFDEIKLYYKE